MVRSMLRKTLAYISSKKWDKVLVKKFNKLLLDLPLNINEDRIPDGSLNTFKNRWKFIKIKSYFL